MILQNKIIRYQRSLITDDRGWFIKTLTGKEDQLPNHTGEIYFTKCEPGFTRGGHYHPKALEWFTIIEGEAVLNLKDIITDEQIEIKLSANNPETIFVPNNIAHIFINESEQSFLLCAYTNLWYQPEDTIQYLF